MKIKTLEMTRGDTARFKFTRLDADGQPITTEADELYFSVKSTPSTSSVAFQVKIDEMEFDQATGQYSFVVLPEYTDNLNFKSKYYYDLEVIDQGVKTTISYGEFILKPEVTWAGNEG